MRKQRFFEKSAQKTFVAVGFGGDVAKARSHNPWFV
jgi:hypothetical protein